MLGTAIAAGASLISGFLGQSSAKKQAKKEENAIREANKAATDNANRMNREVRARADAAALVPVATSREHYEQTAGGVNMAAFMAAAEDYGFNPLTFLRSGALSLFATSQTYSDDWTCTTGERAMDAALAGQYVPQLSPVLASTRVPGTGEVFGNAIQAGANQYLNDLSTQENNKFQMDLLNARLAGQQRPGAYSGPRSFYAPSATLTGPGHSVVEPDGSLAHPFPSVSYYIGADKVVRPGPSKYVPDNDVYGGFALLGLTPSVNNGWINPQWTVGDALDAAGAYIAPMTATSFHYDPKTKTMVPDVQTFTLPPSFNN